MSVRKNWKASYKGWITLSLSLTWFHSCVSATDISFHFTLPKEGDLIGPVVGATPPLINQLKQTLRHSTPIGEWHHTGSPKAKEHNTVLVILFFPSSRDQLFFWKVGCSGWCVCRRGDGQQRYRFGWKWRWRSWQRWREAELEDEAGDARWGGQLGAFQPAE